MKRLWALGLLPLCLLGCAHAPSAEGGPPPRSRDALRDDDGRCVKLAEEVQLAAEPRQVLQATRATVRFDADAESLAPLDLCRRRLARLEGAGATRLIRSVAHGYGLAVVASRSLDEEEKVALLADLEPTDVRELWRGRLALAAGDPSAAEASFRRALEGGGGEAARLDLARALGEQGRPEELLRLLAGIEVRHDVAAALRARAHVALGAPDDALAALQAAPSLDERGAVSAAAPDAVALRSLPAPGDEARCLLGRLLLESGQPRPAEEALREGSCTGPLVDLLLDDARWFEALVVLEGAGASHRRARLRAYALGDQPAAALGLVEEALATCTRLAGGDRCDEHAERARELEAQLRPHEVSGLLERLSLPPPRPWRDDVAPPADPPVVESASEWRAPAGHRAVLRGERGGPFAVTLSQDLDRRETSPGGYWLSLHGEEGWSPPRYLGAVAGRDLVVANAPERAMRTSERLFLPTEGGALVSFELAAVALDSDGDGLSDLYEGRIGTDPARPDSDGDGVDDGLDPLPLGQREGEAAAIATRALGAVLFDDEDALLAKREPQELSSQAVFVRSDTPLLASAAPPVRLVLLSRAAARRWQEAQGPALLVELGPVILHPSGEEALVSYRSGRRAGALYARKTGEGWRLAPLDEGL